jgi:hypothetical protein
MMDDRTLAFHGLAIKRHADDAAVAALTGQSVDTVAQELAAAVATGRAIEAHGGYTLTPLARVTLQANYALHFAEPRTDDAFVQAYHGFERINPDLKQIITDWQTIPVRGDVRGERRTNDHTDTGYDDKVIDRLSALHEHAEPVLAALARRIPRLKIYADKLEAALDKAEGGDAPWVSDVHRDSYHTVWFELHEELLRIVGREREE